VRFVAQHDFQASATLAPRAAAAVDACLCFIRPVGTAAAWLCVQPAAASNGAYRTGSRGLSGFGKVIAVFEDRNPFNALHLREQRGQADDRFLLNLEF